MGNVKSLYANFAIVGTLRVPKDAKNFYFAGENKEGYKYYSIKFGVQTSQNSVVYLDLMGGFHSAKKMVIKTMDKDKNILEVDWKDRNDKHIIDTVADFKKFKANLVSSDDKDAKVYLTEYDFVSDLHEFLPTVGEQRVVVTGSAKMKRYKDANGKYQTSIKYNPSKIRLAREDEENKADLTLSFVFDKESWDESRLADEKKIDIAGYFTTYDKATKGNIFQPIQLVLNCEKLDMDNPKHKGMFDFYKNCFKAGRKEYYETQWHCSIFRGAVEEEITLDDLTQDQRIQIELGMATFEEIKKDMRGGKIGAKVNEIRLVRPTNNYNGSINRLCDYTEDDFIVFEPTTESKEDLFKAPWEDDKKDNSRGDKEIDELFG